MYLYLSVSQKKKVIQHKNIYFVSAIEIRTPGTVAISIPVNMTFHF